MAVVNTDTGSRAPARSQLDVFNQLERLDTDTVISYLEKSSSKEVHTFMPLMAMLMGCDVSKADIIARVREHGARKAELWMTGYILEHQVIIRNGEGDPLLAIEVALNDVS